MFIRDKIEETLTVNEEFLLASEYKNFWGATYRSFRHEHLKRFRIALSIWTFFAFHESQGGRDFPSFCQIQNKSVLLISSVRINPLACLLELGGKVKKWNYEVHWHFEVKKIPERLSLVGHFCLPQMETLMFQSSLPPLPDKLLLKYECISFLLISINKAYIIRL